MSEDETESGKVEGHVGREDDLAGQKLQVKDSYLGSFKLAPGKHTLRLEGRGKNLFSKGRNVGLDSICLRERWIKKRKLLR